MNSPQQTFDSVVVGLGATGMSVVRYLVNQDSNFAVVDSRENPPNADDLAKDYKNIPSHFGDFKTSWLSAADQLIVNPGIALATAEIDEAKQAGAEVIGDIELFVRQNSKPVVAITGSNGKTTVTTLLDLMAKKSGANVATGGNIGTPVLDLIDDADTELFILELSSYQLETTPSLQTLAAVILNVSEDHLDRYDNDLEKYAEAKSVIYNNCEHIVCNREDAYSIRFAKKYSQQSKEKNVITFGLNAPEKGHYGLRVIDDAEWLVKGEQQLMLVSEIKQVGRHNVANALATLALGEVAGLNMVAMLDVLREYPGMIHRTQYLASIKAVNWYNDSKGTNVGATLAALSGLPRKTVLIAGGQGKGADFLPLQKEINRRARAVILMGEDAKLIAENIDDSIPVIFVNNMYEAVESAYKAADQSQQDNVLLSPACASFDMFDNYALRGEVFIKEVADLESRLEKKAGGRNHV
ncbi:MAG: UDP-N-acetylmuramoyl-L-alanine--D-glutamate ligase [Cocleimonas sp.]